jgi:hypothetical protein
MPATDQQVQQFVDERIRPHCEAARALLLAVEDDNAAIGDVYAALNVQDPTWEDGRTDGPPHLLAASDVLAINTFNVRLAQVLRGDLTQDADKIAAVNDIAAQLPVVLSACVRPVGG